MTNLFVVGEPVAAAYGIADLVHGEGRAFSGPGGFEVVLKIDRPSRGEIRAVESSPIAFGVRDSGEGEASFLLQIGMEGEPAYIEAVVRGPVVTGPSWTGIWWGDDVELALTDSRGTCRAVRQFAGPCEGVDGDAEAEADRGGPTTPPCVAVFREGRYGLIQPHGPVTVDTIIEYVLALVGLPGWTPGLTEVWDLRGITEMYVAPSRVADLYHLESRTRKALEGSRTLLILSQSWRPAIATTVRFYGRVAGSVGRSIVVCKTVEEALAKLRIDEIPELVPCEPSA